MIMIMIFFASVSYGPSKTNSAWSTDAYRTAMHYNVSWRDKMIVNCIYQNSFNFQFYNSFSLKFCSALNSEGRLIKEH